MSTGNWIIDTLNDSLLRWSETLTQIVTLLSESPEHVAGATGWSIISTIHGSMQAIGHSLLILFFCMGAFKSMSGMADLKRPEPAFKLFIRFLLAKILISHSMEIMQYIFTIAQGIMRSVSGSLTMISDQIASLPADIVTAINNAGFLESIPLWFVSLIASLIIVVLSFLLLFTIYGRFFKVYMYVAIAPIPISTFAGEPSAHFGKSFLKGFAGVCLQGAVILLACVIFTTIDISLPGSAPADNPSAFTIIWNYMLQHIFKMVLLVFTIKLSDNVTREMLGL